MIFSYYVSLTEQKNHFHNGSSAYSSEIEKTALVRGRHKRREEL